MVTTLYADPMRVPFVDPNTGKLTREGFLYLSGKMGSIPSQATIEGLLSGAGEVIGQPMLAPMAGGALDTMSEPIIQPQPSSVPGPVFRAHANAATNIPTANTPGKVNFQVEDFDTSNAFASSRFQPSTPGYYQINGALSAGTSSGYLVAAIFKNGSMYAQGNFDSVAATTGHISTVSDLVFLNGSTDYVEIYGQAAVAAFNTGGSAFADYFSGALVRPA